MCFGANKWAPSRKIICTQPVFMKWAVTERVVAGIRLPVLGEGHSSGTAHMWPCHRRASGLCSWDMHLPEPRMSCGKSVCGQETILDIETQRD